MQLTASRPYLRSLGSSFSYLGRPAKIILNYDLRNFRPDLIAGLTLGILLLPQSIVFAFIAGLPPEMGLYSAIVGAIVGALWGSSNQLHTGPNNTASLLVLSVLMPLAMPGTPEYIAAAGVLAVMVGVIRLVMGLAKLGVLTNFVSDAVVVGFTAGAGILIIVGQLRHILRITIESSPNVYVTLSEIVQGIPHTHTISLALGIGTLLIVVLLDRFVPKAPGPLIAMIVASAIVAIFSLNAYGVKVVGSIPSGLPPLAHLPLFDFNLLQSLAPGALAVAAIGLVGAASISRSLATQTGQRLDSNQEFVGQGLASIASGFFSGFPGSASFNRSAVSLQAGARTAIAAVISGVAVAVALLFLTPYAAYIPTASLAGLLMLIAYRMIDRGRMARILRSTRGDAAIMITTLLATLLLPLQFAVLAGILMSLAYYLLKTSVPVVLSVLPDDDFKHLIDRPDKPQCPQLSVIEIRGDLYFGAVGHVEDVILDNLAKHPGQHYLLLRMQNIQHLDISGVHMLESVVRTYREHKGDVYITKVRHAVQERMHLTGFESELGEDHFLEEDTAISYMFYKVLDPTICIYECEVRAFLECQNLPRPAFHLELPQVSEFDDSSFRFVTPKQLYQALRQPHPPVVIDVREPREFGRGHIPEARNIPLPKLLVQQPLLPQDRTLTLVCRTGRRSRRAAQILLDWGYEDIQILDGGMMAWDAAQLLEAIDSFG